MLEVEAAANAVYAWAGEQILSRRLSEERPSDPAEHAAAIRHEQQALRHRAHHGLMQAFLEPEIFDGAVTLKRPRNTTGSPQLRRVEDPPPRHPYRRSPMIVPAPTQPTKGALIIAALEEPRRSSWQPREPPARQHAASRGAGHKRAEVSPAGR